MAFWWSVLVEYYRIMYANINFIYIYICIYFCFLDKRCQQVVLALREIEIKIYVDQI